MKCDQVYDNYICSSDSDVWYVSKYRDIWDVSQYNTVMLVYWYFCSGQFVQFNNEGILFSSFIKRFSLFSTNAMH